MCVSGYKKGATDSIFFISHVVHDDVPLDRVLFVVTVARVCLREKMYLPLQQQQQHDNDQGEYRSVTLHQVAAL